MKHLFIKRLLILIGVGVIMSSCVRTQKITQGNVFYKLNMTAGVSTLDRYKVSKGKGFKADITDNGGNITIDVDDVTVANNTTKVVIQIPGSVIRGDALLQASGDYFFKTTKFDATSNKRKTFVYYGSQIILKSLTVPLKIRPALTDSKFGDAFPKQVETGFNFGLALGWKLNRTSYFSTPNFLGLTSNQISLTPSILFNLGAVALSDKNTIPAQTITQTVLSKSFGGALMIGFNRFSFGIARGKDYVSGSAKNNWVYQGKPWTGIIVALDLFK